jgi:hypothetical protein
MACKFVNASGSGTTEAAIDCLEYVKTMKDRGFDIVATSNSWGAAIFHRRWSMPSRIRGRVTSCLSRRQETEVFSGLD